MKQNFNNAGFANTQASVLNLPSAVRHVETDRIRTDIDGWILDTFELSTDQQTQLQDLSPAFKQQIADAVADSWDAGQLILFDKQAEPFSGNERKEKTVKEVVLEKMSATSQSVRSQDMADTQQVAIRIKYG